jgi:hypothetical protein
VSGGITPENAELLVEYAVTSVLVAERAQSSGFLGADTLA